MSTKEISDALCSVNADRLDKIADDDEPLHSNEQKVMDCITLKKIKGIRSTYWTIVLPDELYEDVHGSSSGYELWGDKNEDQGDFKMSISLDNDDQMTRMSVLEALLKRKLGDGTDEEARECAICPKTQISREYGLKADISLKPSSYPAMVYMQSSDCVIQTPAELTRNSYEEGGMPSIVKQVDTVTNKMPRPLYRYNVIASIRPTICIAGLVKYKVTQIVIGDQVAASSNRTCVPISLEAAGRRS
jgi:hypothetical protein